MDSARGYDFLAPWYDALAFIVFGNSLYRAQIQFLSDIPPKARLLVLGGGTGRWLSEAPIRRSNPEITYVDISSAMLRRAQAHGVDLDLKLVESSHEYLKGGEDFDVVIAFCFFDLFNNETLPGILERIKKSMKPGANCLVVDFVNRKWWHTIMLATMYGFFGIATSLKNRNLPDWEEILKAKGFHESKTWSFYGGFIKSGVWSAA